MQDDNQKVTVEDQELANMIAGLNASAGTSAPIAPPPAPPLPPAPSAPFAPAPDPDEYPIPVNPAPPVAPPEPPAPIDPAPVSDNTDLENVKRDVLDELRPLVDKLDLPAEEKFDTLLLLIRSTDDRSLIAQAHAAAKAIPDEARRASALLDIVKEIDFFENPS